MKALLRRYKRGLESVWLNAIVAFIPSHSLRLVCYRAAGMKIGKRSCIYGGAEVRQASGIVIGADCIIGQRAVLDGRMGLTIGDNVNFSTGVWIWTLQHDYNSSSFAATGAAVTIGSKAWLSCRTTVLPGVTIGEGAVLAAGAVAAKDVADYIVAGGIPAKKIADRNRDLHYRLGDNPPTPFI